MKKSVGVILMTIINGVQYAILQRRGRFNTEKMKPESYPGCCQVSVHGGLKDNEDFLRGLRREVNEEYGVIFGSSFVFLTNRSDEAIRVVNGNPSNDDKVTYAAEIPSDMLDKIRLGPDSGGLDLIQIDQVEDLVPIVPEMKMFGPELTSTRAMFPDEIEAVRKAFEIFSQG